MSGKLDPVIASVLYGRHPSLHPPQKAAITPLLLGLNIILTSGTGSGKTEAVSAPLVSRHWREAIRDDRLFLLYIAPTKALINDIARRLGTALDGAGIRLGVRHGDRDDLPRKPNFLVTTPESLEVMLIRGELALKGVQVAVLDEIHLLYNTQRGLQLSVLLQRLKVYTGAPLQWAALSATVGNPVSIRDFFFGTKEHAEFLEFPAMRPVDTHIGIIEKEADLLKLFKKLTDGSGGKLLVFVDSRKTCERICASLRKIPALKSSVLTHYSSLSKEERLDTEAAFQRMRTAVCVATSTLELGIDIGDIDAVVLWGVPPGVESFLQRIGRSNRRSHKTNVICLVSSTSEAPFLDALMFASQLEAAREGKLPAHEPYELFGAAVQQVLSVIVSRENEYLTLAELAELFMGQPHITEDTLRNMLDELTDSEILKRHPHKNRWCANEALFTLKDEKQIYSNFPRHSKHINLFHGSKRIGDVPCQNRFHLNIGDTVRFAGRVWTIRRFMYEGIGLEPNSSGTVDNDFRYGGKRPPAALEAINDIWRLVNDPAFDWNIFSKPLKAQLLPIVTNIQEQTTSDDLPFFRGKSGIRYYTFAGKLVNKAVCLMIGQSDAEVDDVSILVRKEIDWAQLPIQPEAYASFASDLMDEPDSLSVFQLMLPNDLLLRESFQSWLRNRSVIDILARLTHAKLKELTPAASTQFEALRLGQ
ncbi:MAG: DEAD/DEAH box helicase [Kiritimatiellae bacterium]|nr:DEAD/DEAH box helicase [Kiritimatiellia bacterium]